MLARTKRDLYEIARLVVLISGALALAVVFHRMILKGPDAQIRKFKTAALFEAIDANADGRILIEEFSATHEEPFVQVWLRSLVDNSFWYERREGRLEQNGGRDGEEYAGPGVLGDDGAAGVAGGEAEEAEGGACKEGARAHGIASHRRFLAFVGVSRCFEIL